METKTKTETKTCEACRYSDGHKGTTYCGYYQTTKLSSDTCRAWEARTDGRTDKPV